MPPVRVGLETGGKAGDREHEAGDGSDGRDKEAWVGGKEGIRKVMSKAKLGRQAGRSASHRKTRIE